MIVGFSGNDGSGKTTTLGLVCNELKSRGIPFKIIRGFDHLLVQHLKTLLSYILCKKMEDLQGDYSKGKTTTPKAQSKSFLYMIWPYFVFLDSIIIFIKAYLTRNKVIFFDRYFYDHAISFKELGYSSTLIDRLFLLFPKPDVGFIFDANPSVAYNRKKHDHEGSIDYYGKQRERYLALALRKGLPVINTTSIPPAKSCAIVTRQLFVHPKIVQLLENRRQTTTNEYKAGVVQVDP